MFGRGDDDRDEREERRDDSGGGRFFGGGNVTHGGAYPAGGGFSHDDDDDLRGAAHAASQHAGDSGDSSLFGSVLNAIGQRKGNIAQEDIDENAAVQHHKQFFGDEDAGNDATSGGMGTAAAMQALKMFSGGQAGGGGSSQSQFIGLAMSEGSKLFDRQASQGRVSSNSSKESVIQEAGEMALKMYLKSQGGGQGGMGGLMSMASKFM